MPPELEEEEETSQEILNLVKRCGERPDWWNAILENVGAQFGLSLRTSMQAPAAEDRGLIGYLIHPMCTCDRCPVYRRYTYSVNDTFRAACQNLCRVRGTHKRVKCRFHVVADLPSKQEGTTVQTILQRIQEDTSATGYTADRAVAMFFSAVATEDCEGVLQMVTKVMQPVPVSARVQLMRLEIWGDIDPAYDLNNAA